MSTRAQAGTRGIPDGRALGLIESCPGPPRRTARWRGPLPARLGEGYLLVGHGAHKRGLAEPSDPGPESPEQVLEGVPGMASALSVLTAGHGPHLALLEPPRTPVSSDGDDRRRQVCEQASPTSELGEQRGHPGQDPPHQPALPLPAQCPVTYRTPRSSE